MHNKNSNKLIEPMEFYEPSDVKSRDKPLYEPMEFFEPNNIKMGSKKILPDVLINDKPANPLGINPNNVQASNETSISEQCKYTSVKSSVNLESIDKKEKIHLPKAENEDRITAYATMFYLLDKVKIMVYDGNCYVYNGRYYEFLTAVELAHLIMQHCRSQVRCIGKPKFVDDVVDFIMKEPSLIIKDAEIQKNLLSFENCVLNIATGILLDHSSKYYTLYAIKGIYLFEQNPPSPYFDEYLLKITQGDYELVDRIWQMIGYILTPDTSAKVFFLLQGVKNSGKSVLTTVITKLFTENAIMTLDVHSFSREYVMSELVGKSICISPDLPATPLDSKSVSKIKQLTGNDTISSNVKFSKYIQFKCTAKFVLATNHPLLTKMTDDAFYDRIITIPFKYSVPKYEQDFSLVDRLLTERNAIVTKAIRAYFKLVKNSYKFSGDYAPNQVVMKCSNYDMDYSFKIFQFIQDNFIHRDEGIVFTYDAYEKFVKQNGDISLIDFSRYFVQFTNQLFNARKSRKRKPGVANATSCVCGISWSGNVN